MQCAKGSRSGVKESEVAGAVGAGHQVSESSGERAVLPCLPNKHARSNDHSNNDNNNANPITRTRAYPPTRPNASTSLSLLNSDAARLSTQIEVPAPAPRFGGRARAPTTRTPR